MEMKIENGHECETEIAMNKRTLDEGDGRRVKANGQLLRSDLRTEFLFYNFTRACLRSHKNLPNNENSSLLVSGGQSQNR